MPGVPGPEVRGPGVPGTRVPGQEDLATSVQAYVTLVDDFAKIEELAKWLGPSVERVWLKADSYAPETLLDRATGFGFDLALFPPGVFGGEMAGRLAARLGGSAVIGLRELSWRDGQALAKKSVYSQNLSAVLAL
ncbi:MAG: hypothetical protein LBJ61_02255, partial [Deltaproteobacteria bacterium]|nr:hypothetical protein [Deltaproteobacteria bacterium]